ncbi:hypothetical protein J4479_04395 [Candidatus Woesearchaeota archaeon]|nr:hypothetical protein [Candidatus Woesearchaeota archaeon]
MSLINLYSALGGPSNRKLNLTADDQGATLTIKLKDAAQSITIFQPSGLNTANFAYSAPSCSSMRETLTELRLPKTFHGSLSDGEKLFYRFKSAAENHCLDGVLNQNMALEQEVIFNSEESFRSVLERLMHL